MRQAVLICCLLFVSTSARAATLPVPSPGYPTIQSAIAAALDGDTVLVSPGTYVENIDFLGKRIVVRSASGPGVTVIDGGGGVSVVTFQSGEDNDSRLEGFTLTNGTALHWAGGGGTSCWYGSSPTITGNVITGNNVGGGLGGGIYCDASSPVIVDNVISGNTAAFGGGISCRYACAPLIQGNDILNNVAILGGGGIECYNGPTPQIRDNRISGNSTTDAWSYGGGIYCYAGGTTTIEHNVISGNVAGRSGGGIYCGAGYSLIHGNTIRQNVAQISYGGGIALVGCTDSAVTDNVVAFNQAQVDGGGIYTFYSPQVTITNDTVFGNTAANGGGVYCGDNSLLQIHNTILWGDSAGSGRELYVHEVCTITDSDVDGGLASVYTGIYSHLTWGLIYSVAPGFVDASGGDFHLPYDSPCRDIGNATAPGISAEDFEGDPRAAFGGVDLGADECHPHLYFAGQATPGGSGNLRLVGAAGTIPVLLWMGAGLREVPIQTGYGPWYLEDPIFFTLYLGALPSPSGLLDIPFTLPPTTPVPLSLYLQAGMGTAFVNAYELRIE
ncbi:MAG: right-handed parallel beta-helix repeat-containing protein [Planctomycetes bacterium]|nr:right-handed parallel beta-helix repeat-containing protein [Planctomycetota bacterium]